MFSSGLTTRKVTGFSVNFFLTLGSNRWACSYSNMAGDTKNLPSRASRVAGIKSEATERFST